MVKKGKNKLKNRATIMDKIICHKFTNSRIWSKLSDKVLLYSIFGVNYVRDRRKILLLILSEFVPFN